MDLSEKLVAPDLAVVRSQPNAIEKTRPGATRILSKIVGDALALTNKEKLRLATARFRIGQDELREPDYLQLVAWAEQLQLAPREVLRRLKAGLGPEDDETKIENGSFIKLLWDPGLLPLCDFQISHALRLQVLSFTPMVDFPPPLHASPGYALQARILNLSTAALPELKRLVCAGVGLESLVVGQAAKLESLDCGENELTRLDLANVPELLNLDCANNGLTELDLADVPELLNLDCHGNWINGLNLGSTPKLQRLDCSDNDIQVMTLTNLPELVELDCSNPARDRDADQAQPLRRLDLRGVPKMERLICHSNRLESLDLSCVPKLQYLTCSDNPLAELDLSGVALLEGLFCQGLPKEPLAGDYDSPWIAAMAGRWDPPWIAVLDIRELRLLKTLDCDRRTLVIQRPDQHFSPE